MRHGMIGSWHYSSIGRTLDRQSKGSGFGSPECQIDRVTVWVKLSTANLGKRMFVLLQWSTINLYLTSYLFHISRRTMGIPRRKQGNPGGTNYYASHFAGKRNLSYPTDNAMYFAMLHIRSLLHTLFKFRSVWDLCWNFGMSHVRIREPAGGSVDAKWHPGAQRCRAGNHRISPHSQRWSRPDRDAPQTPIYI